jgi:glutamate synthase domain-containing protein 3
MSGGIAYVLDQVGDFPAVKCNRTGVDLEPVTEEEDIAKLRQLIAKHAELTGSPQAKWILDNWETTLPRFVKVFPHEYKRVLGVPLVKTDLLVAQAAKVSSGQVIRG